MCVHLQSTYGAVIISLELMCKELFTKLKIEKYSKFYYKLITFLSHYHAQINTIFLPFTLIILFPSVYG
jgi:hypothetical protein